MRDVVWVGSSREDLQEFPEPVRRSVGYALYRAQNGEKHPDAKPLKGFQSAGVLEISARYDGDTYRTVYTVQFSTAVYVLHAFMKKSTRGVRTPERQMDLVRTRLKQAHAIELERRLNEP